MGNNLFNEPEWKSFLVWHQLLGDRFSISENSTWGIWLKRIRDADALEAEQI